MSEKALFSQYCSDNKNLPYFFDYAYYQTIYGNNWDVILVEKGGVVMGIMPFIIHKNKGFNVIRPEFLIPYQGIWINYPTNQKYNTKIGFEKEVISKIIEQLPDVALFRQQFHPNFTNWLPFYWKGYQQTTRYTFILDTSLPIDEVYANFHNNTRREIQKAEKALFIEEATSISDLYQLKVLVYKEKNNSTYPISLKTLETIYGYFSNKETGKILLAKDKDNTIHAAVFYVWDAESAYYLQGASNTKFKTSGAISLLLWEAIKRTALLNSQKFNFEGSMVENVHRYFANFGGKQVPYFEISKTNNTVLKLLRY